MKPFVLGVCSLLATACASLTPCDVPTAQQQEPKPRALEGQLLQLLTQASSGDLDAQNTFASVCQTRYPDCFQVYQSTKHEPLRERLRHELHIAEVEAADAILLATAPSGEPAQGGVIDHHYMWLSFDHLQVLFANAITKQNYLLDDRFLLARGTSADTYLCELLRRDVEQHQLEQIWVLKRRLLMHGDDPAGVNYHEFVRLPASAKACVQQLRK